MPKDQMLNGMIYLTRRCPYSCRCCALHKSDLKEMSVEQWIEVKRIFVKLGIEFMLIQGNEPMYLGADLVKILSTHPIPYAMYASCHPHIFRPIYKQLFKAGIDNLACGVDSYVPIWKRGFAHTQAKSYYAIDAFKKVRKEFPKVDCQATCTISAFNAHEITMLVNYICGDLDMCMGLNFIHSDVDGKFDFFPSTAEMKEQGLLLTDRYRFQMVEKAREDLFVRLHMTGKHKVFGLEDFLDIPMKFGITGVTNTQWHCEGNPYGGPTVDVDGSLRLCGMRKGEEVAEMTIFDLDKKGGWAEWKRRMKRDGAKCPGCLWNCARMHKYYRDRPELAKQVFVNHAMPNVGDGKGTKRVIE